MFFGLHHEEGQGLVEYALILSLIAVAAIFGLGLVAGTITGMLSSISASL